MASNVLPAEVEAPLLRFREFYQELFEIKRLLREGDWTTLLGRALTDPIHKDDEILSALRTRLRHVIAAQGFATEVAQNNRAVSIDSRYVMAAVADEALLHGEANWPGRAGWQETPLEAVLYRTRIAGDRIFEAAETLAKPHIPDPEGVAVTLLLALQMGFRGRYFPGDPHDEIGRLRKSLLARIFHDYAPSSLRFNGLMAGAAEPLLLREPHRLPQIRPWSLAIGGLILAYLAVSWMIWRSDVREVLVSARNAVAVFQSVAAAQPAR
jgi:type IV/VI secretion system ImpK/VasF family protein